jgi:hypothetical protein
MYIGVWTGSIWLSWQPIVNAVIEHMVTWNAGNFLTTWKQVGFSRKTLFHRESNLVI